MKMLIFSLTLISVIFYFVALPSLNGDSPYQLFADSLTYHEYATSNLSIPAIFLIGPNLVGPVILSRLLENNFVFIFMFNILLFVIGVYLICNSDAHINPDRLILYLVMSPILITSFFGINKEIVAFLSTALLIRLLKGPSIPIVIGSVVLGAFVRWQFIIFIPIAIIGMKFSKAAIKQKILFLFILLLGLSLIFPQLGGEQVASVKTHAQGMAEVEREAGASGVFPALLNIQEHYGYFIVALPKIFQLLYATVFKIKFTLTEDFYNNIILGYQSLVFVLLTGASFIKYKLERKFSPYLYIGFIYCIIFGLTPIFTVRYLFPFHVYLSAYLALNYSGDVTQ